MHTFKHPKAKKVLGFLHAKGLLWVRGIEGNPLAKIPIQDALWVAENIEPRVFEVLPAALLHYPKTFLMIDQLPDELKTIVRDIQKGKKEGPNYKGILYKDMLRWANIQLDDKRTKREEDKKTNITFRLTEKTKNKLKELAQKKNTTMTTLIEEWVKAS